jgi:hypothetical protein
VVYEHPATRVMLPLLGRAAILGDSLAAHLERLDKKEKKRACAGLSEAEKKAACEQPSTVCACVCLGGLFQRSPR